MDGLIGQTLGNWRLKRVLGEGAFGAVFEAEHTAISGRRGAVKVLKPELSMQASMKQRFLNEASAASRAEHENIVQVFDGGITADGSCYQVMELLSGNVLTKLLARDRRLDAARSINIAAQIASALQAAHNLQIIHRDLKPDNVFIVERAANAEFVKVLDFGVAKLRGDPTQTNDKLTSTGMIIGTAPYMSPEQWQGRPDVDGRADVYSLGVMLFEMLCGQRPYAANNAYEWIVLHMEATPPDLAPFGVSAQLGRVVRRMLARQPELRQQSMREVIVDLRTASRGIRNIAAFTNAGGSTNEPTAAVSSAPYPEPPAAPFPVPQPPQPVTAYTPQPSYQQPSYQQPSYQQQSYSQPSSQQQSYPQQQPLALATEPSRARKLWIRAGEYSLMALVGVGYLLWNWREVQSWWSGLLSSLHLN